MNKRNALCRRLLSVLTLVVAMWLPAQVWADITPVKPSAGDGTSTDPYQISNAAELYWFAEYLNRMLNEDEEKVKDINAILTSDITVNTGVLKAEGTLADDVRGFKSWTPIGTISSLKSFSGTFDGRGHTISGLYFNDENVDYVGLFRINKGTIKNVGVIASYFHGKNRVGAVCGQNYYGTVTNCFSSSTINGYIETGGVGGFSTYSNFTRNYNTGSVLAGGDVGGVCGFIWRCTTVSDCYNTGSVTCNGSGANPF